MGHSGAAMWNRPTLNARGLLLLADALHDCEHPAAMHHGKSASLQPPELLLLMLFTFGMLFLSLQPDVRSFHPIKRILKTYNLLETLQYPSTLHSSS
ncbi:hypothetical protein ACLKA6_011383 [Drosophila palustris]